MLDDFKFQLPIKKMLSIPANVYWKDTAGRHLGCNEHTAEDTGFSSPKDYIGRTIYEISEHECAKTIDEVDKGVMKTGQIACLLETSGSLLTPSSNYFTVKTPLYNDKKKIMGLFGISFKLNNLHIEDIAIPLINFNLFDNVKSIEALIKKQCSNLDINKKFTLTPKESEILYYICQGKTAKEIGRILNISYRTVELHTEHLKEKTRCRTKLQLLEKFIRYFPKHDKKTGFHFVK